jgi:hypothetical protein
MKKTTQIALACALSIGGNRPLEPKGHHSIYTINSRDLDPP